jgi:hypothetical protein
MPSSTQPASPAAAVADERPPSHETLTLELAYLLKLKADELFLLLGNLRNTKTGTSSPEVEAVSEAYEEASRVLGSGGVPSLSPADAKTRQLLIADITYRKFLLAKELSFWGGVRTLVPEIPVTHLRRIRSLLEDLEKLASEIEAARQGGERVEQDIVRFSADAIEARGAAQAASIQRNIAELRRSQAATRRAQLDARLEAIASDRAELRRQVARAQAQMDAAAAKLGQAFAKAVTAATGAPDWVVDAARGTPPQELLKQAALKELGSSLGSDTVFKARVDDVLQEFNTSTSELIKVYEDVKQLESQVRAVGGDLNRAAALLRRPTLDSLTELGLLAWSKLPEDQQRQWRGEVAKARPVFQALSLMRSPEGLGERVKQRAFQYIASQGSFTQVIEPVLLSFIDHTVDDAAAFYGELLARIADVQFSDDEARLLIDSLLRAGARWFVRNVLDTVDVEASKIDRKAGDAARAGIRRQLGVTSDVQIEPAIVSRGLGAIPGLSLSNGRVTLQDQGKELWAADLVDLLRLPNRSQAAIASEAARAEGKRLISALARQEGALRAKIVELIPVADIDAQVRRLVCGGQANERKCAEEAGAIGRLENAWRSIVEVPDEPVSDEILDRTAGLQVANVFLAGEKSREASERSSAAEAEGGAAVQIPAPDPSESLAYRALDAAFPGVGTAAQIGVSIIQGLADSSAAQKSLDAATARIEENFKAEAVTRDLRDEAEFADDIAERESELHAVLQDAAQTKYEALRFGVGSAAGSADRQLTRIKIRRSMVFYLAERLREEYDLLDRAAGLWGGFGESPRGIIDRMIREDPQNVRLALDSEIQLYSFLDRGDVERLRTDVDRILLHWRQMLRLAEDVCGRIGCETGTVGAAQVRQSQVLYLSNLLRPADAERLKQWSARGAREPFVASFFIDPDQFGEPTIHRNVRLIDIRLAGVARRPAVGAAAASGLERPERTEPFVQLSQVTLAHSGLAYVPRGDGLYERESLLPRRAGSFAFPMPFDVEALRQRWAATASTDRRLLEGYSPFAIWQIAIEPEAATALLDDVAIRFAYQYQDPVNIITEQEFVAFGGRDQAAACMFKARLEADDPNDATQRNSVMTAPSGRRTVLPLQGAMEISITSPRWLGLLSSVRDAADRKANAPAACGHVSRAVTSGSGPTPSDHLRASPVTIKRVCRSASDLARLVVDGLFNADAGRGTRSAVRASVFDDLERDRLAARERSRILGPLLAKKREELGCDDPMVLAGPNQ